MDRKFTTNSKNYTDKHNNIMDLLLDGYVNWGYDAHGENDVDYDENGGYYYPTTERGLEILEYLRDCDLICEMQEGERV